MMTMTTTTTTTTTMTMTMTMTMMMTMMMMISFFHLNNNDSGKKKARGIFYNNWQVLMHGRCYLDILTRVLAMVITSIIIITVTLMN